MTAIHVFCFWFSVRLGTLIVGVFTLVQVCFWLTCCVLYLESGKDGCYLLYEILENIDINRQIIKFINIDTYVCAAILTTLFACLLFSCILLFIGTFQCNYVLLYPFVGLNLAYIIFLLIEHVFLMLNFKDRDYGLGPLILYSNIGGFIILFLLYMWICVFSFVQIIMELKTVVKDKYKKNFFKKKLYNQWMITRN